MGSGDFAEILRTKISKKMTPKNAKTLENQGLRASNKSCSQLFSN